MSNYGLGFLFDVMRDLVISNEFVDIIYAVIAKIVKTLPKEQVPVPEMPGPDADGNEPSDDDRAAAQKKIEEATKMNQDIDRFNEDLQKLQSKVKVVIRPNQTEITEVGLMRLHNQRDQQLNESSINASQDQIRPSLGGEQKASARDGSVSPDGNNPGDTSIISLENFSLEDLPLKAILVDPKATEDTHLIVYHSEAQYHLRKIIIDVAKRHFKELDKLNLNAVLGHTAQKTRQMEERFEEHLIRTQGFGKGCQVVDKNMRITWKTFLQE